MPTLAELVEELSELDIGLGEIQIPNRLYRQIIDYAEELSETEEDDSQA